MKKLDVTFNQARDKKVQNFLKKTQQCNYLAHRWWMLGNYYGVLYSRYFL